MRKFLMAVAFVAASLFAGAAAHACNVPNPNINAPPFVDGCPVPASALNKLGNGLPYINVQSQGALGNGTTNDSAAIQASLNLAVPGQTVYFPPTGHAYVMSSGVTVPNGVIVRGAGVYYEPASSFDNTTSDWTQYGSYVQCNDTVNPCFRTIGNYGFYGLNFWQIQPTPPVVTQCANPCTYTHGFAPTVYPAMIEIDDTATGSPVGSANFGFIEKVHMPLCYFCVDFEGNDGLAGRHTYFAHDQFGNLGVGMKIRFVDNDFQLLDVKFELAWMDYSSDVLGYTEGGNKIDEDWAYVAGVQQTDVEHDFSYIGIQASNQSVVEPFGTLTFAAQGFDLKGENFNEVCRAIYIPPTSNGTATVFQGKIIGGTVNTDFDPSPIAGQCANGSGNPWAIDVQSDQVWLIINGLQVFDTQGILAVGGGSLGNVTWPDANSFSYSNYTNGGNAFKVASGAKLIVNTLDQVKTINSAAGTKITTGSTLGPYVVGGGLSVDGLASTVRPINFTHNQTNCSISGCASVEDWSIQDDSSNNLSIFRYGSTGSFVDAPVGIVATTGVVQMNDGFADTSAVTIATLPSCAAAQTGVHRVISNGITSPTFQQVVSSTGGAVQPVFCNGTNWIYQ